MVLVKTFKELFEEQIFDEELRAMSLQNFRTKT